MLCRATQLAIYLVHDLFGITVGAEWTVIDPITELSYEVERALDRIGDEQQSDWRRLTFRLRLQDRRKDRWLLAQQWLFALNHHDMATAESSRIAAYLYRPVRLVKKQGWGGVVRILKQTGQGLK